MTTTDLATRTTEYLHAMGEKRFDDLQAMLHPELVFKFVGPDQDREGAMAAWRRLGNILDRNEIQRVFVDGDEVCVIYDFVTDTAVGPVRSIEWITFDGPQIRQIELLFEQARWPEVIAELEGRLSAAAALAG